MTREKLAENIGAWIAAIGDGATNAEVTAAILRNVDQLLEANKPYQGGIRRDGPRWQFDLSKAPHECWIIGETTHGHVMPCKWNEDRGDFYNGEIRVFLRAWQQLPNPSIQFYASAEMPAGGEP